MLVSKLSNGKYAEERQLFAEPISDSNVKLMGEMIALQALCNVMPYDFNVVSKLYNGLVKDLNRISQIDYTITDGYDYAQTAICFLYQFKGMYVSDIYGKDRVGKHITIKAEPLQKTDNWKLTTTNMTYQIREIVLKINRTITKKRTDCSRLYISQTKR